MPLSSYINRNAQLSKSKKVKYNLEYSCEMQNRLVHMTAGPKDHRTRSEGRIRLLRSTRRKQEASHVMPRDMTQLLSEAVVLNSNQ
jgi:hypothetical protein